MIDWVQTPGTADGVTFTTSAELGDVAAAVDLTLSITAGPALAPAGIAGITIPAGAQALRIYLNVLDRGGGAGTGPTTSYRLSGDLEYSHQALGTAQTLVAGGLKPLWIWS